MEEKLKCEDSFVICDKHLGNYFINNANKNNFLETTTNVSRASRFKYSDALEIVHKNKHFDISNIKKFEYEYVSPLYQTFSLRNSISSLLVGIVLFIFLQIIFLSELDFIKFLFPILFSVSLFVVTQLCQKTYKTEATLKKSESNFINVEYENSLLEQQGIYLFIFINVMALLLSIYYLFNKSLGAFFFCLIIFTFISTAIISFFKMPKNNYTDRFISLNFNSYVNIKTNKVSLKGKQIRIKLYNIDSKKTLLLEEFSKIGMPFKIKQRKNKIKLKVLSYDHNDLCQLKDVLMKYTFAFEIRYKQPTEYIRNIIN